MRQVVARTVLHPYLLSVFVGVAFAVALYPVWRLEGRWFYVVLIGFSLICLSLAFIRHFEDFLLAALLFTLPVGSFTKWFFIHSFPEYVANAAPYSGAVGLGPMEFILAGLYFTWFSRLTLGGRRSPAPRASALHPVDWLACMLVVTYLMSLPGAPQVRLGLYATEYLLVHLTLYFYVSRQLKLRHLRWFALSMLFALALESSLGVLQSQFGMFPGLALDKGKGGEALATQYEVPGIEDRTRGTGTIYDSHAFGLFGAFLAVHAIVFAYMPALRSALRFLAFGCIPLATLCVLVSYSRSSWLVGATVMVMTFAFIVARYRPRGTIPTLFGVCLLMAPAMPWALDILHERLTTAPGEIMSVRFEQYEVALSIWRDNPFFGHGVGNYMLALDKYNFDAAEELLVHNTLLFMGSDTGLFGVLVYCALLAAIVLPLLRYAWNGPEPLNRFALGALVCVLGYTLDGMSNPLFRDPVIYKYFWYFAAFAVALPRLSAELARSPDALGWPFLGQNEHPRRHDRRGG